MNAFADSLFSICFGWLRSLVQNLWAGIVGGDFSSFFAWLGDNWLWLTVFLVLLATALDLIIWMIRWRPYLVWRTKWRRFVRWLRHEKAAEEAQAFSQGYQDGPDLGFPMSDIPFPEDWADTPFDQGSGPAYDPASWAEAPMRPLRPGENEVFAPPPAALPYDTPQPSPLFPADAPRPRRRSDRYAANRAYESAEYAPEQADAETQPYAPSAYAQPYPQQTSAWQRPVQPNEEWINDHE